MIVLPDRLRHALIEAAVAAQPDECCGLLVGHAHDAGALMISRIAPSRNVTSDTAANAFEIDPQVRFTLMRQLRGSDEAIIGHYHSHPKAAAAPSARDRACVHEPDLVWLIIGLAGNGAPTLKAWRYEAALSDFAAVPITAVAAAMTPRKASSRP